MKNEMKKSIYASLVAHPVASEQVLSKQADLETELDVTNATLKMDKSEELFVAKSENLESNDFIYVEDFDVDQLDIVSTSESPKIKVPQHNIQYSKPVYKVKKPGKVVSKKSAKSIPAKKALDVKKENEINQFLMDIQRIIENLKSFKNGHKVFGITSAVSGEGSSTIVGLMSALAAGMNNNNSHDGFVHSVDEEIVTSKTGKKGVLLIDTQLRNPSLNKNFAVNAENDLVDLLSHKITFQTAVKNVFAGLDVITLATKRSSGFFEGELEKLASLLEFAKAHYEYIFLDIPAVMNYPEGLALSRLCDGVVLVVKAGNTRFEAIKNASQVLKNSGVRVLGGVLNQRKYHIPELFYKRF